MPSRKVIMNPSSTSASALLGVRFLAPLLYLPMPNERLDENESQVHKECHSHIGLAVQIERAEIWFDPVTHQTPSFAVR